MVSHPAKEVFIQGITHAGKTFRPSDWADRLCGVMSHFRPGGPQPGSHLTYSPWCVPTVVGGIKCVVVNAQLRDAERVGFAQYLVPQGQASAKAMGLATRIAENAPLTNYALMHALPRIAEQPADQGFLTEALMAAIAQSAPEAKSRVKAFLDGKAAKVKKG